MDRMEEESPVDTFMRFTGAENDVAQHYLEACNYDLDRAVDSYLENAHFQPPAHPALATYPPSLPPFPSHPSQRVEPLPVEHDYQNEFGDDGAENDDAEGRKCEERSDVPEGVCTCSCSSRCGRQLEQREFSHSTGRL